jgi:hypothetical protein
MQTECECRPVTGIYAFYLPSAGTFLQINPQRHKSLHRSRAFTQKYYSASAQRFRYHARLFFIRFSDNRAAMLRDRRFFRTRILLSLSASFVLTEDEIRAAQPAAT